VTSSLAVFEAAIRVKTTRLTKLCLKARKKEKIWKLKKFLHKVSSKRSLLMEFIAF